MLGHSQPGSCDMVTDSQLHIQSQKMTQLQTGQAEEASVLATPTQGAFAGSWGQGFLKYGRARGQDQKEKACHLSSIN